MTQHPQGRWSVLLDRKGLILSSASRKPTGESLPKLPAMPPWASPVLQGLAFWLGYQRILAPDQYMSEGAIVAELGRLLFAHREPNTVVEPEVFYRHIRGLHGIRTDSRTRIDLTIARGRRPSRSKKFAQGQVISLIEVKHRQSDSTLVLEDINYLGDALSQNDYRMRGFLIYASEAERPTLFTDRMGRARKPRISTTKRGVRFKVRRVCRAIAKVPSENAAATAHYAVLIEVLRPTVG